MSSMTLLENLDELRINMAGNLFFQTLSQSQPLNI